MTLLSVPNIITAGQPARAQDLAGNFAAIETVVNGGIGSDNISAGGVAESNLANTSVATAKLADDAVTLAKVSPTLLIGQKTLTGNVTLATSSLTLTDWQAVTGLDLAAYTPAVDSVAFFHGVLTVSQGVATPIIYVGVTNGSVVCAQSQIILPTSGVWSIPISGFCQMTANTAYTFKVSVKSDSDAANIVVVGTDARAQIAAFAIPR